MSMFFTARRGCSAAETKTGSEASVQTAVSEQSDTDNVVTLNVKALLGGDAPDQSPLRAFKASLDDTSDAGSFTTQRPRVRLLRLARERRLSALKALSARKAVGISDRRPELILSKELQR